MCIQKKKKDTISQVVSPLCLVACVAVWIWLKKRGNRRGGEEEKKKKHHSLLGLCSACDDKSSPL